MEIIQEIFEQGSDLLTAAIKTENNNKENSLKLYNESLVIFKKADAIQSTDNSTKKIINDNIKLINCRLEKLTKVTPTIETKIQGVKIAADPKLIKLILDQMVNTNETKFVDIAGQEEAKQSLKEMVIWPNLNPKVNILNYKLTGQMSQTHFFILFYSNN